MAQIDLTVLPKAERDSALVAITQNFLLRKFPKWYRKDVQPVISQGNFIPILKWQWSRDKSVPEKYYKRPDYLKPEDVCYTVTLYYKNYMEEGFAYDYTAYSEIVGKTGEICRLFFGSGFGHSWYYLRNVSDVPLEEKRLSALPEAERDSILNAIAQKAFKEKYPDLYREHLLPYISTHDFSVLRIKWKRRDESIPDYVNPADTYYIVNLYYKDWQKERDIFSAPAVGSVYIVEKTREVYKVTEERNHKLPNSGDE